MGDRNTTNVAISVKNANLCGEKRDMRTLLKCAKYAAIQWRRQDFVTGGE